MNNFYAAHIGRIIGYSPDLRRICNSVTATILMARLDSIFMENPDGFSKFLAPCDHSEYVSGKSLTEELGFSKFEVNNAFQEIGIVYKSKTDFINSEDVFQGNYYCCYIDRHLRKTFYFRNHSLVDFMLLKLAHPNLITNIEEISKLLENKDLVGSKQSLLLGNKQSLPLEAQNPHKLLENKDLVGSKQSLLLGVKNPLSNITKLNSNTKDTKDTKLSNNDVLEVLDLKKIEYRKNKEGASDTQPGVEVGATQNIPIHPKTSETRLVDKKIRGKRLPEDWEPNSKLKETLKTKYQISDWILNELADQFIDHWHSSALPSSYKVNWDSAFRNWCRKSDRDLGTITQLRQIEPKQKKVEICQYCEALKGDPTIGRKCPIHG